MKKYGSFIIVENATEWSVISKKKDNCGSYWLCGAVINGLPNTIIKENFPLVFKRFDSPDLHFADSLAYMPINEVKADLIASIEEYIDQYEKKITDAKCFLATL